MRMLVYSAQSYSCSLPRDVNKMNEEQTVPKPIPTSLYTLALLGLIQASPAFAEETYVIREGKLIKRSMNWPDLDPVKNPFWKGWVHCGGKTVKGFYVVEKRPKNHSRFQGAKSALGDCEFKVIFSCTKANSNNWNPNITIADRGRLRFSPDGGKIWLENRKTPLPLKKFEVACKTNVYDGKLHSMGVKRRGNKISFYYDDTKVNEQQIDPFVNLYIWFDALGSAPRIKSIRLTATKLSDKRKTFSTAPLILPAMFSDNVVLQRDKEVPVWGWARSGATVRVSILDQTRTTMAAKDGKWIVRLSPLQASTKPTTLKVTSGKAMKLVQNVLVGEVWICAGQSNMDRSVSSCVIPGFIDPKAPLIRRIHVPKARASQRVDNFNGRWTVCSDKTFRGYFATSFYFGYHLHKQLGVPVGIIDASWGGQRIEPFIPPEGFAQVKEIDVKKLTTPFPYWRLDHPSTLYNGMISGVIPFAIRGAAWYQAESNGHEGESYVHKMRALVYGWRSVWKQGDFPFYFVQLPGYLSSKNDPEGGDGWAGIREAQRKAAATI